MIKNNFFQNKKMWITVVLELIVGCFLIGLVANSIHNHDLEEKQEQAKINAMTYSERIEKDINSGVMITNCNRRTPPDGFAEQNGRDAERAD